MFNRNAKGNSNSVDEKKSESTHSNLNPIPTKQQVTSSQELEMKNSAEIFKSLSPADRDEALKLIFSELSEKFGSEKINAAVQKHVSNIAKSAEMKSSIFANSTMFAKSEYPSSGLTKEECDLMLDYLNKNYTLYPEPGKASSLSPNIKWQSTIVYAYEEFNTKMKAGSPIVAMLGLSGYDGEISRRSGLSPEEISQRIVKFKSFLKNNAVIQGKFNYNDDNGMWHINDVSVLAQLKQEALAYNASKESSKNHKK